MVTGAQSRLKKERMEQPLTVPCWWRRSHGLRSLLPPLCVCAVSPPGSHGGEKQNRKPESRDSPPPGKPPLLKAKVCPEVSGAAMSGRQSTRPIDGHDPIPGTARPHLWNPKVPFAAGLGGFAGVQDLKVGSLPWAICWAPMASSHAQ